MTQCDISDALFGSETALKNFVSTVISLFSLWSQAAELPRFELPTGGNSYLGALNQYGEEILKAQYEPQANVSKLLSEKMETDWQLTADEVKAGVTTLAAARYSIEYPSGADCNPWSEELLKDNKDYRDKLVSQINEAASFLSDYHFRMLGQNHSLFKIRRVVICTTSRHYTSPVMSFDRLKSELTLYTGPKRLALVGPSSLRRDNLHPLSAKEIRAQWDDGEHWRKDISIREIVDSKKNPIRGYWNFLNPVGETRTLLREAIRAAGLKGLGGIRERVATGNLQDWKRLIREKLGRSISEMADKKLEAAPEADVKKLLSKWEEKMASPDATESMAAASLIACIKKRMEKQKEVGIRRTQIGFVNVENFHQIDVSLTTGDVKDFEEFVVVPEKLDIDVTQVGLVNVSTTDQVSVSVALSALGSSETFQKATLASALKAL